MAARSPRPGADPELVAVTLLDVDDLRVDTQLVRRRVDSAWVAHLMSVQSTWPPVVVAADGTILDGIHRAVAAQRLGLSTIPAYFSDAATPVDQLIEAARANAGHGLRLSRAERSDVARRLVAEAPELSDRRIAAIAGMSPTTIGKYRRESRQETDANADRSVQLDDPSVQLDTKGDRVPANNRDNGAVTWRRRGGPQRDKSRTVPTAWWRRVWSWICSQTRRLRGRDGPGVS